MLQVAPVSQQIWDMKYRLKTHDGEALDKTIADSWRRVARDLARPEADPAAWEEPFFRALENFHFLPAGRILSGAGSGRRVTMFNCFVMGAIPDDLTGIFEHLKQAALTMQQGGGIGYDFSTLRPKGAPVKGVGADASGPLSFMDVWDAMCRTIMSAGARRGAMMAVMRCDHPDIEAFIEAKQQPGRLRMFNLSVLITDAFMQAVKEDAPWQLCFDGVAWKSLKARELWDKIMRATYAYAEPGVVFIDRINQRNNLYYCETINATNPCVTATTWVHTAEGPRQVAELVGRSFTALVDGVSYRSEPPGFFATGTRPVLHLETIEGFRLRLTADHLVRRVTRRSRFCIDSAWAPAAALRPGDEILIHDHQQSTDWPGEGTDAEGYLLGLLVGDGTLKQDKAVLSVWPGEVAANGDAGRPGIRAVMSHALTAARSLPHRADFAGWIAVPGRGEYRLALGAVRRLAHDLGLRPGSKTVTPAIERQSALFTRGFLRGLFDADGSMQGTQLKGISVRLAQSDTAVLEAVQRMLLRIGIVARIYRHRRLAGTQKLPDGRGGLKTYPVRAQHELVIAGENVLGFAQRVGFTDSDRAARLTASLAGYRRAVNRERFVVTVEAIEPDGVEEVFDCRIPGINAFDANGLYVHNCGEQPLPPYGTCLLGSLNLASLVDAPFEPEARIDEVRLAELTTTAVRMLDNVIDVSRYPLPEQEAEAQTKRRIGLGVTGLADALILCGARYGGARAVTLTEGWLSTIRRAAYLASADLAREKGAFPLFDAEKYLAGETVAALDADVRDTIARHGIRNALLTSVAPTGTISLLADNVSSGLEPVFSFSYVRHMLMPDGSRREEEVSDHAYRLFRRMKGEDAPLPDYFVDAQGLSPRDHLVMQAAVQQFIDSSISKTINCPEDIAFEAFKDVYMQAYELGCKGCTTYRPNEITGAVLEVKDTPAAGKDRQPELPLPLPLSGGKPRDEGDSGAIVQMFRPLDRPEALPGKTYKVRWPESDHAIYITLNDIVQDGRRRPFEVFINSKNMEHYAWTVALTRMISAVFRRGGDVSFVVEELKAVFDPRGGQWMRGRYVPSLLAAIGEVIETHMIDIGFLPLPGGERSEARKPAVIEAAAGEPVRRPTGLAADPRFRQCPKCGSPSLIRQEDCDTCTGCGYSKCS
ncbi:MAG TPA: LAGLIDADG family homing endonuclease [Rhodospirillales bacterium]|nr:LAGLIDADG family homing endonuclease [Rhodospirillales bacterium]